MIIPKAIVLTCIDFRLIDDIVNHMNKLGYLNNYDKFILADASLGFNSSNDDSCKKLFEEHINLAKDLHNIEEIIIINHLRCGMYENVYCELSINKEFTKHKENLLLSK